MIFYEKIYSIKFSFGWLVYEIINIYYKDLKNKNEKLSYKKKSDISEEIVDRIINQIN